MARQAFKEDCNLGNLRLARHFTDVPGPRIVYYPGMAFDAVTPLIVTDFDHLISVDLVDQYYSGFSGEGFADRLSDEYYYDSARHVGPYYYINRMLVNLELMGATGMVATTPLAEEVPKLEAWLNGRIFTVSGHPIFIASEIARFALPEGEQAPTGTALEMLLDGDVPHSFDLQFSYQGRRRRITVLYSDFFKVDYNSVFEPLGTAWSQLGINIIFNYGSFLYTDLRECVERFQPERLGCQPGAGEQLPGYQFEREQFMYEGEASSDWWVAKRM